MVPVDNGVVELPVRVSPPPESVFPLIESVVESADVGLTSDVISFEKFNEMKNDSAYSSVPNNRECIDPSEDLPIEIKHLIEKSPACEIIEDTLSIILGNETNPQIIQIGSTLNKEESEKLIILLKEFKDVFAWSYEDMPGIDPNIAYHSSLILNLSSRNLGV